MTVGELIDRLAGRFEAAGLVFGHGFDSAWDEATALVLGATGLPDDRSVLDTPVSGETEAAIETLARQRVEQRVPLAYLIGSAAFAGHRFLVEPGTVVPRSPIGHLIRRRFEPWLRGPPARILDLCCGSGCIGIAAALAFPDARVDLVDVDERAVDLARRNVALHGVESRAVVWQSNLLESVPAGAWDLILSNPPYVDRDDMAGLPAEYAHEPELGLAGGDDGLDVVARILAALPARLAPGGTIVCEVGMGTDALLSRYPEMPFLWPDLPEGGEGVFILQP